MDMELLTASYEDVISTLEDSNIELTRERDEQNEQLVTLNAQVILCDVMCCALYSAKLYSTLLYSTLVSNTLSMAPLNSFYQNHFPTNVYPSETSYPPTHTHTHTHSPSSQPLIFLQYFPLPFRYVNCN